MPIGNDVVDIGDPACQPDAMHPRFDSRVFTQNELALVRSSEETHTTRWSLWAAKESAFKACRKVDPMVRFLPREFSVDLGRQLDGPPALVVHPLGAFNVWLDRTGDWVHALASTSNRKPNFLVKRFHQIGPGGLDNDPSEVVRQLAHTSLAPILGASSSRVRIVSDQHRIPRAELNGRPAPIDLSLSHDSRFVACAWETGRAGRLDRDGPRVPA